jgi:hypothetical protein
MSHTAERNLKVALEWQKAGAYVFVAKPENKRPFLVGWRDKSTTDPDIVKEWFKQWPNALPAIDLAKSGHVVIDGDRHHDGPDGVCHAEQLFAEHGLIASAIPTIATPQNGRHYWFTQPTEGEPIGNSDKPVRDKGINVRGAGGYVIAPGALLPNDKGYGRDPNTPSTIGAVRDGTVPVLPPSIVALLRPNGHPPPAKPGHGGAREEAYAQAALANVASEITKTCSGSRNIELNNGALRMGHMVASGWIGRATVVGRLFDAAAACGLINDDGAHSVRATIKSGLDAGEMEPQAPLSDRDDRPFNSTKPNAHDHVAQIKQSSSNDTQTDTIELVSAKASSYENGLSTAFNATTRRLPPLMSSAAFCESFVVPDPLVEGIIMRGFIYALTAHTGKGKTAVALMIAYCVAMGRKLGELDVEQGRVLFLAGENPVDVKMRWIAMSRQLDFDRDNIDVKFFDRRFKFSECMDEMRAEIAANGGFDLIIIDSSFAFFEGDDENSNAQQGEHASRLRKLTEMAGRPAVLVLCHPPKNAPDDNLQPRGGGAYVAEIDGNLVMTLAGMVATLHWQTKFRGPDFAPVNFQLHTVTHEELKTTRGKLIPTVYASALSDVAQEEMQKAEHNEENLLLHALKNEQRGISQAELTRRLGWTTRAGKPNRQKVSRVVKRLKKSKFIEEQRGLLTLTNKGQKEADDGSMLLAR